MTVKRQILLSLCLVIVILISGCRGNNIGDGKTENLDEVIIDEGVVEGGEAILPLTNFKTLNPLITENSYYYQFSKLIFEGIFDLNKNLEPVPRLAESYDILNGGQVVAIKIKDNIKWHDGKDFTAHDIGFTIDTIKAAGERSIYANMINDALDFFRTSNLNNIINYRVIDNKNIEIIYDKSYSNALEVLTFPIIPRHVFMERPGSALEEDNYTPVGTGPYKFVSYEKYKNISLKSNEDYWDGKPYIASVSGRVFEDEELILTAFETGQISFASTTEVDWDKYKQNDRIKVLEYTSSSYEFLGFNFNNPLFTGEKGLAIRQAINYAIDRQAIIQRVLLGHGTQVDLPIHPDSYLMSSEGYLYGYNVEKAKELLKDAGFTEMDEDGKLIDEEGKVLTLRFTTNSYNPYRLRTAELIVEYLRNIGMDIIIDYRDDYRENMDVDAINQEWELFNSKIQRGDFDIVLLGWDMSTINNLSPMFHSSQIARGTNFIKYSDEAMDQLILNTYISPNQESKLNNYKAVQKRIVEELPYVSLFFKNRGLLTDSKIRGDLNPNLYNIYNGLDKSHIPKSLQ